MNDFLNPKSMMTPGIAGALVMFLSNAICLQFPEVAPRWAGLVLSFLLGGVVVTTAALKPVQKMAFGFINSLVIFAVAFGSAGVASRVATPATSTAAAALNILIAPADAQNASASSSATAGTTAARIAALQAQLAAAQVRIQSQQAQLEDAQKALAVEGPQSPSAASAVKAVEAQQPARSPVKPATSAPPERRFFKQW
jgi:hypothetical protein